MSPILKKKGEKFTLPSKYLLFILTIICFLSIVVTFFSSGFDSGLNYAVSYVIVPYQKGISSLGKYFSTSKELLADINDLKAENASLKERIAELENENTRLMQDKYELNNLRVLFELDNAYEDYTTTGARVIYKDSTNWFSSFVVDKGSDDGIKVDMNVMCDTGLVGRITAVGPNWSRVTTIISDNFNVSGMVLATEDTLIISGNLESMERGYINFSNLIDSSNKVKSGDKLVTSYISDKYLPGILVGYISEIYPDSNNLTKSGYLIPAVDFNHIEEVLIILDMKQNISVTE